MRDDTVTYQSPITITTMLAVERQQRLLDLIRQRKSLPMEELSDSLGVSASTVRRDVEHLETTGEIQRTHGGVVWVGDKQASSRPYAFDQRLSLRVDSKRRIARAAKALVQPGQTLLIDGGTTTFYFAEALRGIPLQIVTNSLSVAEIYHNDDNVELVLTGGQVEPRYGVTLGPIAEQILSTIHTQTLFLSVAGLHEGNLYNLNASLVQAERAMIHQSQKVVLLLDSGKFGQQALSKLCDLKEIDTIVTDLQPSDPHRKMLADSGVQLIVAP